MFHDRSFQLNFHNGFFPKENNINIDEMDDSMKWKSLFQAKKSEYRPSWKQKKVILVAF